MSEYKYLEGSRNSRTYITLRPASAIEGVEKLPLPLHIRGENDRREVVA